MPEITITDQNINLRAERDRLVGEGHDLRVRIDRLENVNRLYTELCEEASILRARVRQLEGMTPIVPPAPEAWDRTAWVRHVYEGGNSAGVHVRVECVSISGSSYDDALDALEAELMHRVADIRELKGRVARAD